MRLSPTVLALPLAAFVALAPPLTASESTKTLRLEQSPTGRFAVENLAGTMHVTSGSGDKVVVVATIHAESDDIADSVRLEQVTGEQGIPTLRVIYPIDRYTTFRYPRNADSDDSWSGGWLAGWFGGSSTSTKYAGKKVKVSETSGVILYADVEVQLPRRAVEGSFRNLVGRMDGIGVEGTLMFDTGSGDVTLENAKGAISADTGSGNVKATDLEGSFLADTGSGNISLDGFQGDTIKCDTGSGNVTLKDVDSKEIDADTGSGNVTIDSSGSRLTQVKADTGSGNVTLRMDPDASFEAMADLGSGNIVNRYHDAEPITKDREIVGYRRGDARTHIVVDTGSGNFTLEPGR